jgi:hypothetical protein
VGAKAQRQFTDLGFPTRIAEEALPGRKPVLIPGPVASASPGLRYPRTRGCLVQIVASAAGEKLAAMLTMKYLRREAAAGCREDLEKYLAAVADVPPPENDRLD